MNGTIGTIVDLKRDDMVISSAQIIFATIQTEDGENVAISWVNVHDDPVFGHLARERGMDFEDAWKNAEKDMKVSFVFGIHGFSLVK